MTLLATSHSLFQPPQLSDQLFGENSGSLTFEGLLASKEALASFSDFLLKTGDQGSLNFYLNCIVGSLRIRLKLKVYRAHAQKLFFSDSTSVEDALLTCEDLSVIDSKETNTIVDRPNTHDKEPQEPFDSEVMSLREFGVNLCNGLLMNLPYINEDLARKALKSLTASSGPPDPDIFINVEESLIAYLSSEKRFGRFLRSPHYLGFLTDADLSKEEPETSLVNQPTTSESPTFSSSDSVDATSDSGVVAEGFLANLELDEASQKCTFCFC
ncbi:sorting nexin 13 [Cichlidogyrus casuarinus]|uniref:Sorting nexin 13 n=1 Tax=Cichlidogyrus casuarinus TaxID=1844966 RepID=A0ABD2Q075_9PLAT